MIEIIEFTDPVCTWCWGSEPILRKLETRYKDDVKVGLIMGGLVEDMRDFQDELNGIGGELSKVNKQIASHWVEASKRHGMPVQPEGFALFTEEHTSTYPTNIAYKAAQLQGQEIADQFLRRIREAVATEAKKANRIDVLKEIAKEVGLDENKWLEQMENGIAKQEFEQDLHLCREFQIYTFPSYLLYFSVYFYIAELRHWHILWRKEHIEANFYLPMYLRKMPKASNLLQNTYTRIFKTFSIYYFPSS